MTGISSSTLWRKESYSFVHKRFDFIWMKMKDEIILPNSYLRIEIHDVHKSRKSKRLKSEIIFLYLKNFNLKYWYNEKFTKDKRFISIISFLLWCISRIRIFACDDHTNDFFSNMFYFFFHKWYEIHLSTQKSNDFMSRFCQTNSDGKWRIIKVESRWYKKNNVSIKSK